MSTEPDQAQHDLRGTFVTTALANGRSEGWIADRTGHRSSQMITDYKRNARTFKELEQQEGDLAPLDEAIPELAIAPGLPQHDLAAHTPTEKVEESLVGHLGVEPRANGLRMRPVGRVRAISRGSWTIGSPEFREESPKSSCWTECWTVLDAAQELRQWGLRLHVSVSERLVGTGASPAAELARARLSEPEADAR